MDNIPWPGAVDNRAVSLTNSKVLVCPRSPIFAIKFLFSKILLAFKSL